MGGTVLYGPRDIRFEERAPHQRSLVPVGWQQRAGRNSSAARVMVSRRLSSR